MLLFFCHQISGCPRYHFREVGLISSSDTLNFKVLPEALLNLARFQRHSKRSESFPPSQRPLKTE
jgi:hypothetical protein